MNFLFIISIVLSSQAFSPVAVKLASHPSNPAITWDELLKQYVSPDGSVRYSAFKKEQFKFESYLVGISRNEPANESGRNQQLAYWINAYNAFTVELILLNYPVKSINDINGGKPWNLKFIDIGGKKYSLNDIENEILRKKFSDPRIHFAINCASRSCPKLMNTAYTAGQLDEQLNQAAKNFINDPSKNNISGDKAALSEIFDWYKNDFTLTASLIDFLNKYSVNRISPKAEISYLKYDWSLNE